MSYTNATNYHYANTTLDSKTTAIIKNGDDKSYNIFVLEMLYLVSI